MSKGNEGKELSKLVGKKHYGSNSTVDNNPRCYFVAMGMGDRGI